MNNLVSDHSRPEKRSFALPSVAEDDFEDRSHMEADTSFFTNDVSQTKRVTSCGAHLHGFALSQHSSEETFQQWRAVGDTASDLTGQIIEPKTFHINSDVLNHHAIRPVIKA